MGIGRCVVCDGVRRGAGEAVLAMGEECALAMQVPAGQGGERSCVWLFACDCTHVGVGRCAVCNGVWRGVGQAVQTNGWVRRACKCQQGRVGAGKLCVAVCMRCLMERGAGCYIGEQAGQTIGKALESNSTLQRLNLFRELGVGGWPGQGHASQGGGGWAEFMHGAGRAMCVHMREQWAGWNTCGCWETCSVRWGGGGGADGMGVSGIAGLCACDA